MQSQEKAEDTKDQEETKAELEKKDEESEDTEEEEAPRSTTVFEEISRVLTAIMRNGHCQNLKVKHLAIY